MSNSPDSTRTLYKEFGQRVRQNRLRKKLKQIELAEKIGLSRTSITNIEQGEQRVLLHHVYDLADVLSIPLQDLMPDLNKIHGENGLDSAKELTDEAKKWIGSIIGSDSGGK